MKLITHDGLELAVAGRAVGRRPTIVFVNALGIDSEATVGLADALQDVGLDFLTWNRRGLPGAYDDRFRSYGLDDQLHDLEALIRRFAVEPVILMAWCTGVHTALAFARKRPEMLGAMVVFNCPNFFGGPAGASAGDAVGTLARLLAKDESRLNLLYESLLAIKGAQAGDDDGGLKGGEIRKLVEAPFTSGPQAMLRYAHLILATSEPRIDAQWCAAVTVRTLIVAAGQDSVVPFEDSCSLAKLLPQSTLQVMEDWGHYDLLCRAGEAVEQTLVPFLRSIGVLKDHVTR